MTTKIDTPMVVTVRSANRPAATVPVTILGQNIEPVEDIAAGFLSDRLRNPKFAGPPDHAGLAASWEPAAGHYNALMTELVSGISLSGNESQRIHCYNHISHGTIVQTHRVIRAGETLEVEIWAKVEHAPATMEFSLVSTEVRRPEYAKAQITIDNAYWKRYTAQLKINHNDDNAVFKCTSHGPATVWIDQIHMRPAGQSHLCEELIEKISTLKMPVLRFPGGCLTANYHWKYGTGPVHLRPCIYNRGHHGLVGYDFGTDEYLDLCFKQGVLPQIVVNISTGTPEEAAEWAAYTAKFYRDRGATPPPAYFQIGNEHYGLWEHGNRTGEMYARTLREFVPAIRKAYPNCRIVALGEKWAQSVEKVQGSPWRDAVLEVVKELNINVIVLNRYKGQWADTDLDRQINAVESVTKIRNDLEELIADCRAKGLTNTVGITEWNYWQSACWYDGKGFYESYDAQHWFFTTGMLHTFARLAPDFELGTFYHLVNAMGIFIHRGADVIETPQAELFRLYRPAFPGEHVPLEIDSPKLGENELAVDALQIQQGRTQWLFLCNRHSERAADVKLPNSVGRIVERILMSASAPLEYMKPVEAPAGPDDNIHLPPLSFMRLRCEQ